MTDSSDSITTESDWTTPGGTSSSSALLLSPLPLQLLLVPGEILVVSELLEESLLVSLSGVLELTLLGAALMLSSFVEDAFGEAFDANELEDD